MKGVFSVWSNDPAISSEELHNEKAMGDKIDADVQVQAQEAVGGAEIGGGVYRLRFGLRVLMSLARRGRVPDHAEIKEHGRVLQFP